MNNSSDCISRQAVIDLMMQKWGENFSGDDAMQESIDAIRVMPSVTPQLSSELEKNSQKLDCISRSDAIRVASGYCHPSNVAAELAKLPSVTPQEPRCKDCKWWKDSDGEYRRGCGAESRCPINTHAVYCGEGYCYKFSPKADMRGEEV